MSSFGAGVCFSLLYLRLLAKQVDSMTGGGGLSAPSIFVPVLLFGIFKRWYARRLTPYLSSEITT